MEREKPIVSVVLPSYNGARYIEESIDSVLRQTFSNWELILVNDGSTDRTRDIMEAYAAKDGRIRVIHNDPNQRLPRSLNIGFRQARGKYLTWTSDDNRYLPRAIKVMVQALDADPAAPMVSAEMECIDESGAVTGGYPVYEDHLIWAEDLVGACFMYRREALAKVGEYDPAKVYVEDYDYWLRLRVAMGEIKRVPEMLYQYRRHGASLTATKAKAIRRQNARLHLAYQKEILQAYNEEPDMLCAIYYDFVMGGMEDSDFATTLYQRLPEVHGERKMMDKNRPMMVFGAGEFGEKMVELFGDRVIGFIDNSPQKIGQKKDNREIISFSEYCRRYGQNEDTLLVLAIGGRHLYHVIQQVKKQGVRDFFTYQRAMCMAETA
ncbi:MAG: glycosyltransferase [Schwartzia sp. (in: firmicutes)]